MPDATPRSLLGRAPRIDPAERPADADLERERDQADPRRRRRPSPAVADVTAASRRADDPDTAYRAPRLRRRNT